MANLQIRSLEFLKDFRLDIQLTNGHRIIYDLKPKIETARFKDIDNWDDFQDGQLVDRVVIQWNSNTELSLCEILNNIKQETKH